MSRFNSPGSRSTWYSPSAYEQATSPGVNKLTASPSRSSVHLGSEDVSLMRSSSTAHFRHLSTQGSPSSRADAFFIPGVSDSKEDVTGLHGRVRLARDESSNQLAARGWADKQRMNIQAYEYLCHIGEAKEWIEACIDEEIPPIVDLEEKLRNGVVLAKLTKCFAPHIVKRIFDKPGLHFRHTENINYFFQFLDEIGMPELFTFELTDLYDKKNVPKVIYCVHALGFILSSEDLAPPIGDLVGKLEFTDDQIRATQRGLDNAGVNVPNFKGMNKHFGVEPQVTEEEQMAIDLAECEDGVAMFQAICRGSLFRLEYRNSLYQLQKSAYRVVLLQSIHRGHKLRKGLSKEQERHELTAKHLPKFQARCRGVLKRMELDLDQYEIGYYWPEERSCNLQAAVRGKLARQRDAGQLKALRTSAATEMASKLQAAARGKLARREVDSKRREIKHDNKPITTLQAAIRAKHVQKSISHQTQAMGDWTELQAAARGALFRAKVSGLHQVLESEIGSIVEFQSLTRAIRARNQKFASSKGLMEHVDDIIGLQAVVRARYLRADVCADQDCLRSFETETRKLQSAVRGAKVRRAFNKDREDILDSETWIKHFQAGVRGYIVREWFYELKGQITEDVEFQSVSRGHLVRREVGYQLDVLDEEEPTILMLQSVARGGNVRRSVGKLLDNLDLVTPSIVRLQSIFRGVLARFDYMLMIEEFEEEMETYVELQAAVRGYMVRKSFNERIAHFKKNMDKVIKIQSFVRAKKQGDAYKSLTTGSNPPLSTVKSFVHLLNDSDLDFEQEVELEQSRKRVIDEVRNNEQLEQFITQLDVKIALLLKNKITLDELIKHRNKGHKNAYSVTSATDMFDLKALNKSSRRRLELYQGFFYIIQTQPGYLARLFRKLRENVISEKEVKDLESLVMTIFGYGQKRREEFFLLQLIGRSIREEMQYCDYTKSFMRGNFIWWKLVAAINRNTKERKFLKDFLSRSVNMVIEKDLDLESDPLAIYRNLINNEELSTGKLSKRDPNLPVDEAIQDPETRSTFIANLQKLREFATEFLNDIEQNVDLLPYHVRFIAMSVFKSAKFEENDDKVLALVGHVLFTNYLNPAIVAADNYGIVKNALSPLQTKNLTEVTKMLSQIASLKQFSKENVYLQPLNDFVKMCIQRMKKIFKQVITVPELEQEYEMNVFDDLTSHRRPTLYVKSSDTFAIHSLICQNLEAVAPETDDALRDVLQQLGDLPNDASEVLNIARFTEVKLDLNPSFCRVEDPEAEVNSLFVAAKRCLVYVLRVQTGTDLLDILLSPALPEHEEKYKAILREERRENNRKVAYPESALGDLSRISYRELKTLALEKVIELESYGKITRDDSYQEVLNSIAMDIRTKRNRRVARKQEGESIKQTLGNLAEKETYLQQQLKTYNDYIEQAMATLQNKKGRKKNLVLPFTKQYFHMRGLQKSGRVPKFGSYKYTAANLFEKGVLIELNGYTERQYSQVTFTFSSDQVGVFNMEAAYGSISLPGASVELTLDDLLGQQYNNRQYIALFDEMVKFNTNLLLHFIFKKFYGDGQ